MIKTLRFLLIFCLLAVRSVDVFSQTEFTITSQRNGNHLNLKIGDRIRIRIGNENRINAKLIGFSDSTLTINSRKGIKIINASTISSLKKTGAKRLVYVFSVPVVLTVIGLTTYSIFPPLIAVSVIPTAIAYDLITKNNVKAPLEIRVLQDNL